MHEIMNRTKPENADNYFDLALGDLEETFKLPNFAARQELIQLYATAANGEGQGSDLIRAMAATLGACWWGKSQALEVDYFDHRKDLVRFGDLVLGELEDAGIEVAAIMSAGGECVSRIVDSIPTEKEVKDKQDFSTAEAV
jgi:hypothetical protein